MQVNESVERKAQARRSELGRIRRLELASVVEGSTLILLLFVAVPLKHAAGWPQAVTLLGPVHGMAFLFYVWTVIESVTGGGWSRRETARLLLAAVVPFGGFANFFYLRRKASSLRPAPDAA